MNADRNLLFAVLALQTDFITREQFVEACTVWAGRKDTPMPVLLVEKGWLAARQRDAVECLFDQQLRRHGDRAADALATITFDWVRESLSGLGDKLGLPALPPSGAVTHDPGRSTIDMTPSSGGTGRYSLTKLHATGGSGRVWLAADTGFGREIALKELRPDRTRSGEVRERFVREAKITGQLQHPGIVPVYEIGTRPDGGEPFYTMRFVHGRTLAEAAHEYHQRRERGEAGPLELRDLLTALVGVCQTVAYAHDRGVLHRDLKPQNVVLGDYGEVVVLDWGLARLVVRPGVAGAPDAPTLGPDPLVADADSVEATQHGQVMGTPAYMAPEQAAGELDRIGPATDVYGLGAILYEILTGRQPFTGATTADILQQVREATPPAPRGLVPSAPPALEAICLKAMARVPADRYPTAAALADDLRRFLADEPVSARPDPWPARLGRWARRHRPLVATVVTAVVLLAVTGTAFGMHRVREEDRRRHELALREEESRRDAEARMAAQLRDESAREAERLRAVADQRHAVALTTARAGDVDVAIGILSEVAGFCDQAASLAAKKQDITRDLDQLQRFRTFRTHADAALKTGVHNIRGREKPDPVLRGCEEALAAFDIEARDDWRKRLDGTVLTPKQVGDVSRQANELLILAAIRLAMFDTRDEAGKANTRRALALLDRAAAIREPGPGVWMMRMLWNRRLGNSEAADRAGDTAVRLTKEGQFQTALDYYLLGSVTLHILKRPKDAAASYTAALRLEPNHYGANFGLFLCFSELDNPQAQLTPLTVCLSQRPDEAELYFFRGVACFKLGDYFGAHSDFDVALRRDPNYKLGYYWRGRAHVMFNRWAEAEDDFTRALKLDPNSTQWRSWRAIARAKIGRAQDAVADAEQTVKEEPTQNSTLFFAARAHAVAVRSARDELAEQYGKRAVELLGKAADAGFKDWGRVGPGSDFDPIRNRADFKTLLRKLGVVEQPPKAKGDGK